MTPPEAVRRLVESTRDGPVTEWVERIAGAARRAGLPLERIDWGGSPEVVAFRVAEFARDYHGDCGRLVLALSDGCEHGMPDGEYCEPCNAEYKRAAREAYGDGE